MTDVRWSADVEISSIPIVASLDLPTRCSKSQSSSLVCCSEIWGLVYRSCGCPIPQVLPKNPVGGDDPVLLGIQSSCVPSRRSGNRQGLLGHVATWTWLDLLFLCLFPVVFHSSVVQVVFLWTAGFFCKTDTLIAAFLYHSFQLLNWCLSFASSDFSCLSSFSVFLSLSCADLQPTVFVSMLLYWVT